MGFFIPAYKVFKFFIDFLLEALTMHSTLPSRRILHVVLIEKHKIYFLTRFRYTQFLLSTHTHTAVVEEKVIHSKSTCGVRRFNLLLRKICFVSA